MIRHVSVLVAVWCVGGAFEARAQAMETIRDKTLVAWVYLANPEQRGGSALTLDDRASRFDGIVFGEILPGRWMAGSDRWTRTQQDQEGYPAETAGPETRVQVAVTYAGNRVALYRDGQPYAAYGVDAPLAFGPESVVVMGLRHLDATDRACFAGSVDEARIYGTALSAEQIAALRPGEASDPAPLAWWTFDDGRATDRMGRFPDAVVLGGARIDGGRLHLDGGFLVATPKGEAERLLAATRAAAPEESFATLRAHRERLLSDPHRPVYHFVAPEGHCMPFDPNGAIFRNGRYHLFYIFQDERGHCWGHASSADLLHWRHHPPALYPGPGDPDRGIFSGNCFVDREGRAAILYHGVEAGNCIAVSGDDALEHWTKLPENPIAANPVEGGPGYGVYATWDPHGWLEGDTYYAIFGSHPASRAPATLFRSKNLTDWEYLHPILEREMPGVAEDDDLSCPDFFALGDRHMLLCISHKRGCRYYLGRWEDERFHPESHHWMNWPGGTCFAPESLLDDRGRRIMWAWVLDRIPVGMMTRHGWSGTMSLPRVLSLDGDGALRIEPVEELAGLRTAHRRAERAGLAAGQELAPAGIRGDSLELDVTMRPGETGRCGVHVLRSPDGEERTSIVYDAAAGRLIVDFSRASLDTGIGYGSFIMGGGENPLVTAQEAPFRLEPGEPLRLRIFVDRSIVEVFANGRQCVTQRVYPTRSDSKGVTVFAEGAPAVLESLDAWTMSATNPW